MIPKKRKMRLWRRGLAWVALAGLVIGGVWVAVRSHTPFPISPPAQPPPPEQPFAQFALNMLPSRAGERLEFEFGWQGISAALGSATVALAENGDFRLYVQARTTPALQFIWNMRDHGWSEVDAQSLLPKRYLFERRENREHRVMEAVIDAARRKAICKRTKYDKGSESEFELNITTPLDPISLGYHLREFDFAINPAVAVEFTNGRHRYSLSARRTAHEKVKAKAGEFDCWKLSLSLTKISENEPENGIGETYLWLSSDARRIPVRLSSRVFVGEVYGELIRYSPPPSPPPRQGEREPYAIGARSD